MPVVIARCVRLSRRNLDALITGPWRAVARCGGIMAGATVITGVLLRRRTA